jgi:4-hydroxy-2-oxoglutarate aldolase
MQHKISGIFAPISTPFFNEEVNLSYLRENIHRYNKTSLAGYFVLGSNGENKSLSDQEKFQILETVINEKLLNHIIIAGIATYMAITIATQMADIGADFISLLPPSYFIKQLNDEALIRFYLDISDKSPIPVMAYNAPSYNGVTLSLKVVEKIAKHPNIAGMKDTSPGMIFNYLEICMDDDFDILSGTINTLLPALLLGASGGVVSLANAFPQDCVNLYEAAKNQNLNVAIEINSKLMRLNRGISGSFGVAGVKCAMDNKGFFGGNPRLPLLPLKDEDKGRVGAAIATYG